MSSLARSLWSLFIMLVVSFLTLPLILVVLFSFNASALTSFPLTGFTLSWYERLLANESFWPALRASGSGPTKCSGRSPTMTFLPA